MKLFKIPFTIVLAIATSLNAYSQMTLSGEIRPRTEYRHGYKTLIDTSQSAGIFTSQRTRVNFGYIKDNFKTQITLQDVRVWGNQSQANIYDVNTSSLHEAWGEYSFNKYFSVKAGRQEINYDDQRLFGAVAWAQQGRSHDAIQVKYNDSTFSAHIGVAYNQTGENSIATSYTVTNNYKELYYIWLNKKFKNLSISLIEINNGIQSPASINSTRFSYTAGTHIEYTKDALGVNIRYYHQGGIDAAKRDINANMFGIDFSYTVKKKITFVLGAEILSGQSQTDTAKSYLDVTHQFNPLYGTAHKFNGYMDYFYSGNGHSNAGLNDFYFKTKYKGENWWLSLDIHQFLACADVLDRAKYLQSGEYSKMESSLGTEFDLTFAYTFSNNFTTQVGYSHLLATKTMAAVKGGAYDETQNWAYLMLIFKPVFLK